MIRGQVSEYIPNPTFDVVAAPGAQEEYFRNGNPEGKSYRELVGDPIRCLPAFREPAPRIELMDELGIDRALMFPTLASLIEERMKDDPELIHSVMHALNQWMYETWILRLRGPDLRHPGHQHGRHRPGPGGARMGAGARRAVRADPPCPGSGLRGTCSPGLPEFDPVWSRIVEAGILVGMHASDSGYAEIANWWEESSEFLPFRPSAFRMMAQGKRPIYDTMAALICHGALSRFPDLRIAAVENGANWVAPLLHDLADTYEKVPTQFAEEPTAAFRRNVYVNPFWEDDMTDLAELVGADHILFGSDYPHPEGLRDPISYVDELKGLDDEDVRRIMGGNLAGLMGVGVSVCTDRTRVTEIPRSSP